MPCTPSAGLSHSYISQWAAYVHQTPLDAPPSLDPIPSPARGRVRARKSDTDADEDCPTPRAGARRRSANSPAPLAPVSSRGSLANLGRTRASRLARHHVAAPLPNPTLHFRRLAPSPPVDTKLAAEHRTPSDVTNRVVSRERAATTPSPDLIFNMSPVLGFDGPARPHRVPSRLSAEPGVAGDVELEVPVERVQELHISKSSRDPTFLYSYTPSLPQPEPQYESSTAFSTSRETSDREEDGSSFASTTSAVLDDLVDTAACLIEPPAIPRLGRMHAKSDPLPTRLSSASTSASCRAQPIPIPKPSPRVPSDFGGVNSSLAQSVSVPPLQWARALAPTARLARRVRRETETDVAQLAQDVTGEWSGTADAVPTAPVPVTRRRRDQPPPARKKRFFIAGVGESYDGDMDSELSSWQ
ncbi:hypothetical protein FS749_001043 [Ceratobasidium sp. UAMH 11750]|nr:hypothetical protein FS749_001043 [Ceratobasidium sp. UAMH 11750]